MILPEEAKVLRIFIGESSKHHGKPVYHVLVEEARRQGLAGATAWHGMMGFGGNSRLHTSKILRLSEDLPVVIEIVDTPERIESFLPTVDELLDDGLVILENARVIHYRHEGTRRKD